MITLCFQRRIFIKYQSRNDRRSILFFRESLPFNESCRTHLKKESLKFSLIFMAQ